MQKTKNTCSIGYIYGLQDPQSKLIRYIGQSIDPTRRYQDHILHKDNNHFNYKETWIRSIQKIGHQPKQIILESCSIEDLNKRELYYIYKYVELSGDKLTNYIRDDRYLTEKCKETQKLQRDSIGISSGKSIDGFLIYVPQPNAKRKWLGTLYSKVAAQKLYDSVVRYYFDNPVTNFPGISKLSFEQAQQFCKEQNRLRKYKTKYHGIHWEEKSQSYIVALRDPKNKDTETYISSFKDEKDALLARDQAAKFFNIDTLVHHSCEAKSPQQIKVLNGTRKSEESKQTLYTGSQKDYIRETTGNIGLTFNKKLQKWQVQYYRNGIRHTLGTYKDKDIAQQTYDDVDTNKITINEAKYRSLYLKKNSHPGLLKRGPSYYVNISWTDENGNKQKYTSPPSKDKDLTIYHCIALRNYLNLPTDLSITTDKLSPEKITSLRSKC